MQSDLVFRVEAKGLEPSNLLTASQALYQLSYAPEVRRARLAAAAPSPESGDGPARRSNWGVPGQDP